MADYRDYGHTYLTLDREVSLGGNTPKGGWIAMFYDRVFPFVKNPQHNIEVAINRDVSRKSLEEFIAKSARDPTPWFFHEDAREVGRRVLVYTTLLEMVKNGELKKTISYTNTEASDKSQGHRNR